MPRKPRKPRNNRNNRNRQKSTEIDRNQQALLCFLCFLCCLTGLWSGRSVVAKPHFPCIGWLASYSRTPDLSRADQLSVASCLSRGSRRAPDSDGASRGPIWPSANRRLRRTNFHRERPKNSRCFLAPQTEARPFPYPDTQLRDPHNAARP